MKRNEPITHLMSDDLITANKSDSFSKVKAMMQENQIHHVPVLDGKKLVGMVSWVDVLEYSHSRAFGGDDPHADSSIDSSVSIEDVMTKSPKTIKSSDTIKHAVEMLSNFPFNSLPVVSSGDNHLVGMVTTKDLMNYFAEQY